MAGKPHKTQRINLRLSPDVISALDERARLFHGGNRTAALEALILGRDRVPLLMRQQDIAKVLSVHPDTVARHARKLGLDPIGTNGATSYPLEPFLKFRPRRMRPKASTDPSADHDSMISAARIPYIQDNLPQPIDPMPLIETRPTLADEAGVEHGLFDA